MKNETGSAPTRLTSGLVDANVKAWQYVNRIPIGVYDLPPVTNGDQLNTAALLVSDKSFTFVEAITERLDRQDIIWSRTAAFCYLFSRYIEADGRMTGVNAPRESIASEKRLIELVQTLDERAAFLVDEKLYGGQLNTFPAETGCTKGFLKPS